MNLHFAWPWGVALLPLPLLVILLLGPARPKEAALRVRAPALLASASGPTRAWRGARLRSTQLLLWLAWCALIAAVCRPQMLGDPVAAPTTGRDLLLAVDISGSMNTEDMAISEGATSAMANQLVSRIDAVKLVVQDFIKRRTGDRVGLIVFGTNAYLYVPLTFDRATVADMLSGLHSNMAGGRTAIGDAIGLAVKTLQDRAGHTRVVILLTDGASNAGELTPARAAQIAADQHVRVHTIGFGGDTLRLPGFFGFDSRIVNPSADLDEAALTQVAQITGGRFYRARDPQELTKIYAELDQIEPSLQNAPNLRPFTPLHQWPLAIALVLSLLLGVQQARRTRHA